MRTAATSSTRDSNKDALQLTRHAKQRQRSRGIKSDAIDAVLEYGREVYTRGALIYAIGKREIKEQLRRGLNLSAYNGIQVLCSSDGGCVITVYRNRDFRGLRPH